ncbi:hypothetical protein GDO81_006219 [Engystomops pustulosus]|uniref:Uncharacterized protein n=1 Tax=Engystomops pustulosus TaxID=76066 RepID=A0AAV7CXA3_ENGPU|nr:hypothetical protein GDO81_006219 [Engystomops pustulosus]
MSVLGGRYIPSITKFVLQPIHAVHNCWGAEPSHAARWLLESGAPATYHPKLAKTALFSDQIRSNTGTTKPRTRKGTPKWESSSRN